MEEQRDASEESTDGTNQGSAWQKDDRLSRGRREKVEVPERHRHGSVDLVS